MIPKLKLVMFDLDGTLINTAPEIALATNDTLSELGKTPVSLSQVIDWIGHGTQELLIRALANAFKKSTQEIRNWDERAMIQTTFDKHYLLRCGTQSTLYPGVREVIDKLKIAGLLLTIITNKESKFTERILKAHKLENIFEMVISGDTLDTKKPDPSCIEMCLKKYQVKAIESLFVGDSSTDAQTAKNGGIKVWLMPYGYNQGVPLEDSKPDYIASGFEDILNLI